MARLPGDPKGIGAVTVAKRIDRREFLTAVGAGVVALALPGWPQHAKPGKPNIVVILVDDLGYAELGCQGCKDIPTPHIDSIARNGVRFTDGYVSCPVCAPTRAGLLTGRYQQRFGLETNPGPQRSAATTYGLPRNELTIAERLKPLGYATGMVGKWHEGYKPDATPTRRGFDEFFGFLAGAHGYMPGNTAAAILRGTTKINEKEYLTDAFAREAVAFIDRHADEPFFLYLPFNAVHSPLQATEKYLNRFGGITNNKRKTFAAMASAMDDAVGDVLDALRRHGLEENTLVFFVSDNGGPTRSTTSRNTPLRGFKAQVYEGGIRVPFLVQWKGRVPAGVVRKQPVIALDILPTAIAAAGGRASPDWKLDGANLMPYLTNEKAPDPHNTLYWRFTKQHALRRGDWKLVKTATGTKWELYNLAEDIGEKNDLAAEMPGRVKELDALWQAWNAQLVEPKWVRKAAASQ
jgi:arylsulfatase A-like enzyme